MAALQESLAPMPLPEDLDRFPDDPTNAYDTDPEAALLGQMLFFDECYSPAPHSVSCAGCHQPDAGFQWPVTDGVRTSRGAVNPDTGARYITGNHAQGLFNGAFGAGHGPVWQFWDGRRDSQWAQAMFPPEHPKLMASSRSLVARTIRDHYLDEYEAVFGPFPSFDDEELALSEWVHPTIDTEIPELGGPSYQDMWNALTADDRERLTEVLVNFGKAVAAYERRIVSRGSRYDRFLEEIQAGASDSDHLSASEKRGLTVFMGSGGCIACHSGANLTDGEFHNLGIRVDDPEDGPSGREKGLETYLAEGSTFAEAEARELRCAGRWSDADPASCPPMPEPRERLRGAVRTPTLRGVSRTSPYMHTGTFDTLEDVVEFYDRGGDADGYVGERDSKIQPLNLTDEEKADLVAFLNALDGEPLAAELLVAPPGTCRAGDEPVEPATCDGEECIDFFCGNGVTEGSEECDDGNPVGGDGCSVYCTFSDPCGDGVCDSPSENVESCPADCGMCSPLGAPCGDDRDCCHGFCEPEFGECVDCVPDGGYSPEPALCCSPVWDPQAERCGVGCGDGYCASEESPASCPRDCEPVCGDGNCHPEEALQGMCPQDCGECIPTGDLANGCMEDANCCSDVCDQRTWTCAECLPDGHPTLEPGKCCSGGYDHSTQTCGAACGDGFCDPMSGEDTSTCPADCGLPSCGDGLCQPGQGEDPMVCPEDCANCTQALGDTCDSAAPDLCCSGACADTPFFTGDTCCVPDGEPGATQYCCSGDPDADGVCGVSICGDGACDAGEDADCPQDCAMCTVQVFGACDPMEPWACCTGACSTTQFFVTSPVCCVPPGEAAPAGQCCGGDDDGDGICDASDCGNGTCDPWETATFCPADCSP